MIKHWNKDWISTFKQQNHKSWINVELFIQIKDLCITTHDELVCNFKDIIYIDHRIIIILHFTKYLFIQLRLFEYSTNYAYFVYNYICQIPNSSLSKYSNIQILSSISNCFFPNLLH